MIFKRAMTILIYNSERPFLHDLLIFLRNARTGEKRGKRGGRSQKGKRLEAYKGKEGGEKEINVKRRNECDSVSARFILNMHRDAPANRSIETHVYLYSARSRNIVFSSCDPRIVLNNY